MKSLLTLLTMLAVFAIPATSFASFDDELARIQSDWAVANYGTADKKAALAAFESLAERSHALAEANPQRAEPLVWEGIVLSSWAGKKGGLGALGLAKQAREVLEEARRLDASVLKGSVYTSLGALYYKVPGWPVGFGDDDQAAEYLAQALQMNPDGIDPNFFYGDFLLEQGQEAEARAYLEKALAAPARPGRELADEGRRDEIRQRLASLSSSG
ncbi:MAG: tetratricopeptide repeat protein [Gammaproteobacteria bacterium]